MWQLNFSHCSEHGPLWRAAFLLGDAELHPKEVLGKEDDKDQNTLMEVSKDF